MKALKTKISTAILFALFLGLSSFTSFKTSTPNDIIKLKFDNIKDGAYSSSVYYKNPATGYGANYTLKVSVTSGRVVSIDFGNGGSVHTGYNNEGYSYSGGTLTYKRNSNSEITSASTTVSITEKNYQVKRYDISIE